MRYGQNRDETETIKETNSSFRSRAKNEFPSSTKMAKGTASSRLRDDQRKKDIDQNAFDPDKRSQKSFGRKIFSRKTKPERLIVLPEVAKQHATQQKHIEISDRMTTPEPPIGGGISSLRAVFAMRDNKKVNKSRRGSYAEAHHRVKSIFNEHDTDEDGKKMSKCQNVKICYRVELSIEL